MMRSLLQDIRYALRQLARAPGFTIVAVITLAFAIGANTAIFSIVNALLLRPPANVAEPERIVTIWTSDFSGPPYGTSSYPDYEAFREQTDVMAGVAAFVPEPVNLVDGDETVRLAAERVSANYFEVLGVSPAHGRVLSAEDGVDRRPVAVIGHALWRSRFGGDSAVVGRAIRLNAGVFTVIGVAPEGFNGSVRGLRQPDRSDCTGRRPCRSRGERACGELPARAACRPRGSDGRAAAGVGRAYALFVRRSEDGAASARYF